MPGDNDSFLDALSGKSTKFADPFLLPSNQHIPNSLETALDFCFFLYHLNPQYRMASKRVVAHFVTDIELANKDTEEKTGGSSSEQDELYDFLRDGLDVLGFLNTMGDEWSGLGNGFARIHFPFNRMLIDTRGQMNRFYTLASFRDRVKYYWQTQEYEVPDPVETAKGVKDAPLVKFKFQDFKVKDTSRIKLQRLDPRRMALQHSLISGKTRYIYRFEDWFIQQVKDSKLWQINETPAAMLAAIAADQDFLFDEDQVFHLKGPTLSGVSNNGWGIPEPLINYRNLHQLQIYRRIDEAVGLDYMLPFRVFSPNWGDKVGDATVHTLLGQWQTRLKDLISKRRQDQTSMFALPFPIKYDEFGASGKNLAPKEIIEFHTNDMLDGMGYPAELFRGSLTVQQVPVALRMFENTFHFLYRGFDQLLKWVVRRVCDWQQVEVIGVNLQRPTIADDLERRNVFLQLAAGGQISLARAFKSFGIDDPVAEGKARAIEDIETAKARNEIQRDFEREQNAGTLAATGGGAAPAGGGAAPSAGAVTPLDTMGQAQAKAQEWLGMQEGDRRRDMQQTEASNPQLYALAKDFMEKERRKGESQGRQQVYQSAQQPQG